MVALSVEDKPADHSPDLFGVGLEILSSFDVGEVAVEGIATASHHQVDHIGPHNDADHGLLRNLLVEVEHHCQHHSQDQQESCKKGLAVTGSLLRFELVEVLSVLGVAKT